RAGVSGGGRIWRGAGGPSARCEGAEQAVGTQMDQHRHDDQAGAERKDRADVDVALLVMELGSGPRRRRLRVRLVELGHDQCAVLGGAPRSMIRPSASSNSGSCTGRIARPRSWKTNAPTHTQPNVPAPTTSIQLTAMPS